MVASQQVTQATVKTIDENGCIIYRIGGKGVMHRVDGPAFEDPGDGYKEWSLYGVNHCTSGFAIDFGDGTGEWCVNGRRYETESEWEHAVSIWKIEQAAPDLLASLRDLRAIIHDDLTHARQEDHSDAIKRADAAIAKAEGTPAQTGGEA